MYVIDEGLCSQCGLCADVCPVEAIPVTGPYRIDPDLCLECGECLEACPLDAVLDSDHNAGK